MTLSDRPQQSATAAFPTTVVAGLVILALVIRVAFFIGYQGRDDRNYISYASFVNSGHSLSDLHVQTQWVGRIGFWLPLAASMKAFGATPAGFATFSLVCSLAEILITLWLGLVTVGRRPALLAAGLLAVMPLHVLFATEAYPDLPMGFFMVAGFWLVLKGRESNSVALAFAAGLTIGLAYLQKETAVLAFIPIALALRVWSTRHWHMLAWCMAGCAVIVGAELVFWWGTTADALYRVHATAVARDRMFAEIQRLEPVSQSLIPGPPPMWRYRSENSMLEAVLMLAANEEFGLFYWMLLPIVCVLTLARHRDSADLRVWVVTTLAVLLFVPFLGPGYTLPRDARYFSPVTIPGLLIIAAYLCAAGRRVRWIAVTLFVATGLVAMVPAKLAATMEPQRTLVGKVEAMNEKVWVTPQVADDLVNLGLRIPPASLGVHLLEQGRASNSFQAVQLMIPDAPVAERLDAIDSGILVLRNRNRPVPVPGWIPLERVAPPPLPWPLSAVQAALRRAGYPELAARMRPGDTLTLYRRSDTHVSTTRLP